MSTRVKRPSLADALIHPARLALLTALQLEGPLSARELQERLPAVSQASLYRHLKTLTEAGAIVVHERRHVGVGAPEKTFSIADAGPRSIRLRGRERSADALRRYLLALQAAEILQLERTLVAGQIDEALLNWRQSVVYLDRQELKEIKAIFARLKAFETRRTARQRAFALNLRLFPA